MLPLPPHLHPHKQSRSQLNALRNNQTIHHECPAILGNTECIRFRPMIAKVSVFCRFSVCSVQCGSRWFGSADSMNMRRLASSQAVKASLPLCDFVETPIISGHRENQLETRISNIFQITFYFNHEQAQWR